MLRWGCNSFLSSPLDCHQQDLVCIINKWCHAVDALHVSPLAFDAKTQNNFFLCKLHATFMAHKTEAEFPWLQFLTSGNTSHSGLLWLPLRSKFYVILSWK